MHDKREEKMRIPQTICVEVRVIENDFNLKVFLFILLKITQQGQPPLKLIIQVDYLQMLQYFVHNFKDFIVSYSQNQHFS